MAEINLCSGPVEVWLRGSGPNVELSVKDSVDVSYIVHVHCLEAVLQGETLQVSGSGRHCKLYPDGEEVKLTYSVSNKHHQCRIPTSDLERALQQIKADSPSADYKPPATMPPEGPRTVGH